MLSCFNEKFLDDHSFGQLQEAFKNRNIAQFISNFQVYISKIINNDDDSPFLIKWVTLNCLDIYGWTDFEYPCPLIQAKRYRSILDSIWCFIVFSVVSIPDNKSVISKLRGNERPGSFLFKFKQIYVHVVQSLYAEKTTILLPPATITIAS